MPSSSGRDRPEQGFAVVAFEGGDALVTALPSEAAPSDVGESLGVRLARRAIEIVVASVVLIATAPLLLVLAVIIRLDSPGPALFWQVRMTRNRRRAPGDRRRHDESSRAERPGGHDRRQRDMAGRPFWFVKFRTMHVDARERFPDLYRYEYSAHEIETMKFKLDADPRRTRCGAWLRRTSLDELPNFWNILRGEMTLVGPRPEIPEMSRYYTPHQRRKFQVLPGVTGLAQVNGRGVLTFQETVRLDVEYVECRSWRLDLALVWRTLVSVVRRRGAF